MSGFSAEWLTLRESYDLQARNPVVRDAVADRFKSHDAIKIVDLACGAGSTSARLAHTCRHDSTGISSTAIDICWLWRAVET